MYEIPNQLVYKERIIFNLTFEQLAYAFIFLPIVLLIFRSNLGIEIRVFLSLFPILIAISFMYFNLTKHLKMWIYWLKNRELDSNKIKEYLEIKKIEDDLIYTKSKKLAVLKVESINFQIKPDREKEAITLGFQKLLNSLDFPIQILMTTENLNIEKYLSSLKQRTKKGYEDFFEDYKKNLKNIIENNSVQNRNFYVIISETSNINIQLKICGERLYGLGLKPKRLKNFQLNKLVSQMFN